MDKHLEVAGAEDPADRLELEVEEVAGRGWGGRWKEGARSKVWVGEGVAAAASVHEVVVGRVGRGQSVRGSCGGCAIE